MSSYFRAKIIGSLTKLSVGALMLAGFSAASPASASFCDSYARTALRQHTINVQNRCGFGGARWHGNYSSHRNWCVQVPRSHANNETRARTNGLNRCIASGGGGASSAKVNFCNRYARTALRQQTTNRSRNCGLHGARWHNNFQIHKNWCMRTASGTANRETNIRTRQLNQCIANSGQSGHNRFCNNYANTAVNQQRQNFSQRCGFSGPRWHTNFQSHKNWCLSTNRNTANAETQARARGLRNCRGNFSNQRDAYCRRYAQAAVNQQSQNLRQRCGFRGARWHTNFQSHKNWCMNVNNASADRENRARFNALRQCSAGGGTVNRDRFCTNYAQTAVTQNQRNINQGCGFRAGRWHSNFLSHKNWCLGTNNRSANNETNIRRNKLRQCTSNPGGGNGQAQFCNNYANTAVNQNRQNINRRCGFSGARWHHNFQTHRQWCMATPSDIVNGETRARNNKLRQCNAGGGVNNRERFCNNYANTAVSQFRNSNNRRCGFRGARWHANFNQHKSWCLRATNQAANRETQARTNEIQRCIRNPLPPQPPAGRPTAAECNSFASEGVQAYSQQSQMNCGMNGLLWSGDANSLRKWCRNATTRQLNTARAEWHTRLIQCRAR